MHVVLYSPSFPLWWNILGIIASVFIVPIAIVLKLILIPFERPTKRSASEVAEILRSFIDDTGGEWDFDEFISCEIENTALENLRQKVMQLQLPIQDDELEFWTDLIKEAEALAISEAANPS